MQLRFALPALALALLAPIANAATVTLYVFGVLTDGSPLGGTITIDNTAGTVTAYNVTLGAPDTGTYTVSQGNSTPGGSYFNVGIGTSGGSYPSMSLTLATSTLVGYTGGPLCTLNATCGGVVGGVRLTSGAAAILFTSGSASTTPPIVEPGPVVPALSSAALVALSILLAAMAAFTLRRRNA